MADRVIRDNRPARATAALRRTSHPPR